MRQLLNVLVLLAYIVAVEHDLSAEGKRVTIFHLTSENEFGQPTSVITGDIARTYSYDSFGKPTGRTMGEVMDFSYSFDSLRGNLMSRTDNLRSHSECFGYDELNRLVSMDARGVTYSDYGNIISIDSVGDMTYDNSAKPYQVTSLTLEDDVVPSRVQNVTYTCYSRPSIMTEGGRSAAFTYNGDGARVKMNVSDGATSVLSRYYIGNQYELDVTPNGTTERLYLGGDAYSAPAVYVKEGSGTWTFYNIGRDYLGNITHIATSDGTLVEENSYDPWGRLRNPETREIYSLGTEPELMLGRGYTGHEHLTWFGLINMNARLYDPVLGRFLSPDPFVQAPDFSQSINRYTYCLNNPLVYVDENGEFWHIVAGAIIGGAINFITNFKDFDNFWEGLASVLVGAGAGALSAATGNIALITLGGALNSGVNNVVKQLNPEKQWGDINWKTVGGHVFWGGSISLVGAGISTGIDKTSWVSELLDIMNINKNFARNVAGSTIKGMMVGGGTGVVAGAFRANVTKDWRDIFGGMLNGMAYGAGAGLASSLITEAGYQLQLKNSKSPAISADMAEVISSNTNDIVRSLDVSYMDYNYWDSSVPSMFKDYIQYFNDIWSSKVSSSPTPNVPSSTVINPVFFPY